VSTNVVEYIGNGYTFVDIAMVLVQSGVAYALCLGTINYV
jgi:hypothetical protein